VAPPPPTRGVRASDSPGDRLSASGALDTLDFPDEPDPDGGVGVREPRHPKPAAPAGAVALPLPTTDYSSRRGTVRTLAHASAFGPDCRGTKSRFSARARPEPYCLEILYIGLRLRSHTYAMVRRVALVGAALTACAAAGTSSAASARMTLDFSHAPLGPKSAFRAFTKMPRHGVAPVVLTARARQVAIVHWNGKRLLLVAPISGGGFCASLSGHYGGSSCGQHRGAVNPGLVGDASGPIALNGTITNPRTARMELRYEDGSRTTIPFVWVSAPIRAGFFVFPLSHAHRRLGHRPLSMSLYAADGTRLSATKLH
jgi:hypothetical protein